MASIYQAAWNQLKNSPDDPLIIAASPLLHRRIYKAIIKRKDEDLVFKLQCAEAGLVLRLRRKSNGGQLTIFLESTLGIPIASLLSK